MCLCVSLGSRLVSCVADVDGIGTAAGLTLWNMNQVVCRLVVSSLLRLVFWRIRCGDAEIASTCSIIRSDRVVGEGG